MSVLEDILLELHAGFVDAMALRGHRLPLDGEVRGSGDVGGGDGQGVRLVKQSTVMQFVDQRPVVSIDSNSNIPPPHVIVYCLLLFVQLGPVLPNFCHF